MIDKEGFDYLRRLGRKIYFLDKSFSLFNGDGLLIFVFYFKNYIMVGS